MREMQNGAGCCLACLSLWQALQAGAFWELSEDQEWAGTAAEFQAHESATWNLCAWNLTEESRLAI